MSACDDKNDLWNDGERNNGDQPDESALTPEADGQTGEQADVDEASAPPDAAKPAQDEPDEPGDEIARQPEVKDPEKPSAPSDESGTKVKEQVVEVSKKIGRALSHLGKKFARESGDMLEQGKLEVRIITLDRKLRELEADLGRKIYNLWTQGRIRDELVTSMLKNEFQEIDKYDEEREVAKELLENIRYKPEGDSK